jgi:hypothetical protein
VEVTTSPGLPTALPARQQVELLRIIQEALTNVRKHADATVVRVRAEMSDGQLVLIVADNGRGFSPTDVVDEGSLRHASVPDDRRRPSHQSEVSGGTTLEVRTPVLTAALPGIPESVFEGARSDASDTQAWVSGSALGRQPPSNDPSSLSANGAVANGQQVAEAPLVEGMQPRAG